MTAVHFNLAVIMHHSPRTSCLNIQVVLPLEMGVSSPSHIVKDNNNKDLPVLQHKCTDNFSNLVIQEHEVFDILSVITVNKAVGPDSISHPMLKFCKETISKPLCLLFNKSLSSKTTFPDCWKLAHVIPLFKKDDPSITSNYRPVSLSSCISNIFEIIFFKHLYNFLYSNNLFYK